MKPIVTNTPEIKAINAAFDPMALAIRRFAGICGSVGEPIRSITFRVFDNGDTKLHVTYKRKKKI